MIKLYLDENVPEAVAAGLRLRGYDVITVKEAGRKGLTDIDQFKYENSENRTIFTFNISDFYEIHTESIKQGIDHDGIIFSKQLRIGIIVKALTRLLSNKGYDNLQNRVIWLSDWIKKEE